MSIFIVVSTGHFDPLIAECERLKDKFDFRGQIGSGTVVPTFSHFRTGEPQQIEKEMRDAELVVAHAGTGMLSMLYRLKKRAVVIPKQIRYGEANDGQVELAKKWGELGMAVLCMDVNDLEMAIAECRGRSPKFPAFPSLGAELRRHLGWATGLHSSAAVG